MTSMRWLVVLLAVTVLGVAGGIALGTGVLEGTDPVAAATDTEDPDDPTSKERAGLESAEAVGASELAATSGLLADRKAVLIVLPDAPDDLAESTRTSIETAGGVVVGRVDVTETLLDPAERQYVTGVAEEALVDVEDSSTDDLDNYDLVGAALARALVAPSTTAVDPAAATVLDAFTRAGLLAEGDAPSERAATAVVVTGSERAYRSGQGELLGTIVARLDVGDAGTMVVGSSGSGAHAAAVGAVRDTPAAESVSTVDTGDLSLGQVAVVSGLVGELDGTTTHVGTGPDAETVVAPLPAPSSSPTR